jgi:DNA-binding transcriptional LysR family regulator
MTNMNLDLGDLRAFVAVAERGNFHAAATTSTCPSRRCRAGWRNSKHRSASGCSNRTTRKVELTAVGRDFARKARDLLYGLDQSLLGIGAIAERMSGEVTIACVPSAVRYFLPQVLQGNTMRCIRASCMRITDEGAGDVLSSVARSEADFGVNYIGAHEAEHRVRAGAEGVVRGRLPQGSCAGKRKKVTWAELGKRTIT